MLSHPRAIWSRHAGLRPAPQFTRHHHPDFDRMATQGWKALEAEGKLPATAWRKERQWALDMGLPGAESITDRNIPTFARGELPHFAGINTFMKAPYTEEWNFGVQHQFGEGTALSVDYVGSHGSRLDLNTFFNTAVTPGPGALAGRRPYSYITPTNYERTNGRSSYEALEISLNRRGSRGLSYLLSYTWGKSIDEQSQA